MPEIIWLLEETVRAVHSRQISEHGGRPGIRDEGLLLSALARPQNLFVYGDPPPDLAALAASYAFGIARNHPFSDGNKRGALLAMGLFLGINGIGFKPDKVDAYRVYFALAAGEITEQELAAWIDRNSRKREK